VTDLPAAVLLDVGGVFVLPSRDAIGGALERAGHQVDRRRLDRAHYHGVARIGTDREPRFPESWEDYLEGYCDALGLPPERDDALEHLRSEFATMGAWVEVVADARSGLEAIVAAGVAVGVVSNADGTIGAILRELEILQVGPGPGVAVSCLIDSGEVGVEKPDPRIFHIALEALGVDAAAAWYVGDTPGIDVIGARRAGIRPLLMDPYELHLGTDFDRVGSLHDVAARLTPR
jgi:putative hydrolase of the HAD superfamily